MPLPTGVGGLTTNHNKAARGLSATCHSAQRPLCYRRGRAGVGAEGVAAPLCKQTREGLNVCV